MHIHTHPLPLARPQIVSPATKATGAAAVDSLVEVGPRFCLEPIKLFAGSCGGRVLYDNADFVSPNAVRSALKKAAAGKYGKRVAASQARKARRAAVPAVEDEMAGLFK